MIAFTPRSFLWSMIHLSDGHGEIPLSSRYRRMDGAPATVCSSRASSTHCLMRGAIRSLSYTARRPGGWEGLMVPVSNCRCIRREKKALCRQALYLRLRMGGLAFLAPLLGQLAVQLKALEALLGRQDVVLPAGSPFSTVPRGVYLAVWRRTGVTNTRCAATHALRP